MVTNHNTEIEKVKKEAYPMFTRSRCAVKILCPIPSFISIFITLHPLSICDCNLSMNNSGSVSSKEVVSVYVDMDINLSHLLTLVKIFFITHL